MPVTDLSDADLLALWESFDGEDDRPAEQRAVLAEIKRRNLDI
jgi:hypothetical protein